MLASYNPRGYRLNKKRNSSNLFHHSSISKYRRQALFCLTLLHSILLGGTGARMYPTDTRTKDYRPLSTLRAPNPNRHSRPYLYAVQSYDVVSVDFLHHESLPTWAGVEPASLGAEGQRQTNHPS
ncbi:hypothetical protein TNCV_2899811 [Trichonephila clavipes]|nr:hypothetical protein TNCV_2899811 [Trichonephila clavipes]